MADPLIALRQAIQDQPNNISYHLADGTVVDSLSGCTHIKLGDLIFARDQSTRYRSRRGTAAPYPLDVVCFLIAHHRDSSFSEYLQEAKGAAIGTVGVVDRKDLVALICEQTGTELISEYLDFTEPLPPARTTWAGEKATTSTVLMEPRKRGVSFAPSRAETALPAGCRPLLSRQSAYHVEGKDWRHFLPAVKESLFTSSSSTPAPTAKEAEQPQLSLLEQITRAATSHTSNQSTPKSTSKQEYIIIFPAAPTALLTLHNAREFLLEGHYRPSAEAARLAKGPKEPVISVEHGNRRFRFIDNPTRLSLEEWSRVVAVIAHGPTWQFKGWKWTDPVEIFQHVCGFHPHYDDTRPDPTVAGWNVQFVPISRSKRHLDGPAMNVFWQRLDQWLHHYCRQ